MLSNAQLVAAILALFVTPFAGWLRKDGLADWKNNLISGGFMLFATIITMLVTGKFTGNIPQNFVNLGTEVVVLMAGPLKPLESFLQVRINAGTPAAPPSPPTSGGSKPQLTVVPPRASSVTQATGWQPTVTAWNNTPDQSG